MPIPEFRMVENKDIGIAVSLLHLAAPLGIGSVNGARGPGSISQRLLGGAHFLDRAYTMNTADAAHTRSFRLKTALDVIATLIMTIAALVLLWVLYTENGSVRRANVARDELPKEPLSLAGSPLLGNPQAAFSIIEFSDFECPFCGEWSCLSSGGKVESRHHPA